jgi:hypothetical protein
MNLPIRILLDDFEGNLIPTPPRPYNTNTRCFFKPTEVSDGTKKSSKRRKMSVLPVKMTESLGRSFRLLEIGPLGLIHLQDGNIHNTAVAPKNMAKENILGPGLDILNMY